MRHHFDFGAERHLVGDDLVRPEAWDALRTQSSGPFAIPENRAELEQLADEHPGLQDRARAIDGWLERRAVASLASYGVGVGLLELCLDRVRPERSLLLTDFAPATVARLRRLFPEASVEQHDLLRDLPAPADLHLFHRIDTEFTNEEWSQILTRFADETVLVVSAGVAGVSEIVGELVLRLRRRQASRAGWMRTRAALERLWRQTHIATPIRLHDLDGWVLEPRRPGTPSSLALKQG